MTDGQAQDEGALVRRLAEEADPRAWAEFVDGYGPLLAGLARRMLHRRAGSAPSADVDEVVAEVFLALLRRDRLLLRRYDERFRLSTYLGVITRTAVIRLLRRRRGGVVSIASDDVAASSAPATADAVAEVEERARRAERLERALSRLKARDRLLLLLRFREGMDYRQIAEAVGVAEGSVGQLLHRAKERLGEELGGQA